MQQTMIRAVCALTALLLGSASHAALPVSGTAPSGTPQPLTFCFEDATIRPWRTLDGIGLNFELLKAVSKAVGVPFQYTALPWKRCLAKLKAQELDGAFGASFSEDRLEIGAYPGGNPADPSKRLHMSSYVVIKRKGSQASWDGKQFTQLRGPVGVQLGYSIGSQLRNIGVEVDEGSKTLGNLVQRLLAGRVEVIAVGGSDAEGLMSDSKNTKQLDLLPTPIIEKAYYLVLSHELVQSRPELANKIWKGVETVRQSPAYRKKERQAQSELSR